MFTSAKELSVDQLQKSGIRFYYFGLGFIQLKLNEIWRLHFYSDKLPGFTEDVHNHRYNFTSHILHGEITNELYKTSPGTTHLIRNVSCDEKKPAPALDIPCNLELDEAKTYKVGDLYNMHESWFHRVKATNCITLLERTPRMKEFAQIITPKDQEPVCPYSLKVPDEQMWDIIRDMLKESNS